jgi:Na+-driven multidrug efflux pump
MNMVFVSKFIKDTYKVAGVGMATMLVNVIAINIIYGTASVLETLVSQSLGNKNYAKCNHYLN